VDDVIFPCRFCRNMKSVVIKSPEQKEYAWKAKRHGKITSSTLPDLMKAGKGTPYGFIFMPPIERLAYAIFARYSSSTLVSYEIQRVKKDLMKAGKGTPYGKAFFDALYLVRYERRTGITRENGVCKAFSLCFPSVFLLFG